MVMLQLKGRCASAKRRKQRLRDEWKLLSDWRRWQQWRGRRRWPYIWRRWQQWRGKWADGEGDSSSNSVRASLALSRLSGHDRFFWHLRKWRPSQGCRAWNYSVVWNGCSAWMARMHLIHIASRAICLMCANVFHCWQISSRCLQMFVFVADISPCLGISQCWNIVVRCWHMFLVVVQVNRCLPMVLACSRWPHRFVVYLLICREWLDVLPFWLVAHLPWVFCRCHVCRLFIFVMQQFLSFIGWAFALVVHAFCLRIWLVLFCDLFLLISNAWILVLFFCKIPSQFSWIVVAWIFFCFQYFRCRRGMVVRFVNVLSIFHKLLCDYWFCILSNLIFGCAFGWFLACSFSWTMF